eukprot:sb/3473658/
MNGYSPQTIYSELQLIGFNLMFSALPIISYGLFEQHLPPTLLYEKPILYKLYCSTCLAPPTPSERTVVRSESNGVWRRHTAYSVAPSIKSLIKSIKSILFPRLISNPLLLPLRESAKTNLLAVKYFVSWMMLALWNCFVIFLFCFALF